MIDEDFDIGQLKLQRGERTRRKLDTGWIGACLLVVVLFDILGLCKVSGVRSPRLHIRQLELED